MEVTLFTQLNVLHSGGFATPYRELLPAFEKNSGFKVSSRLAASQGNGPDTIPALLRRGFAADVVIMAREGLDEVIGDNGIVAGSAVDLARTPLGAAVRAGVAKPDMTSVEGFKQAVLRARCVNLVSTTGLYLTERLFPSLGIAEEVVRKVNRARMAELAESPVDLVLRPVSEISNLPGFDFVGPVPNEIQFVTVFTAAIATGSKQLNAAKQLIAFLSSEEGRAAARRSGMEPIA